MDDLFDFSQGSADSNYSQPSSDLSLDEEKETLRREKEKQALNQLQKARVSHWSFVRSSLLRSQLLIFPHVLDHRLLIEWVSDHCRHIFLPRYKHHEFVRDICKRHSWMRLQFQDKKRKKKKRDSARCQSDTSQNFFSRLWLKLWR